MFESFTHLIMEKLRDQVDSEYDLNLAEREIMVFKRFERIVDRFMADHGEDDG